MFSWGKYGPTIEINNDIQSIVAVYGKTLDDVCIRHWREEVEVVSNGEWVHETWYDVIPPKNWRELVKAGQSFADISKQQPT
jgi:hypothetical protein